VLIIAAYWGWCWAAHVAGECRRVQLLPPAADGRFTIADSRNWVALAAFVLVALVVSTMAELARGRAAEAERRRREADLAAMLARELLAGEQTQDALRATAHRVAEALDSRRRRSSSPGGGQRAPRSALAARTRR